MDVFKDRRVIVFGGMGVALVLGLAVAAFLIAREPESDAPPPASQGGLIVETGRDDDVKLDVKRPLRCFVDGKLIGDLTLSDCAQKNGVAAGALDVGLDPSGALAASNGVGNQITPLPPAARPGAAPAVAADAVPVDGRTARGAGCWRYADTQWERLPDDQPLGACVQALYAGQCDAGDAPLYGRWGERTLRLLAGRVEISSDNRNFRTLSDRTPGCSGSPDG